MLSHFNLNQFNFMLNINNIALDLALSNIHIIESNDPDQLLFLDNHHPTFNIFLNGQQFNLLKTIDNFYDFKNCNYINIVKCIIDNLYYNSFNTLNLNELTTHLYNCFNKEVSHFVPK